MKPRIALEISLDRPGRTGVGRYAAELARGLQESGGLDLLLLHAQPRLASEGLQVARTRGWRSRQAWLHLALPLQALVRDASLLHVTNAAAPFAPCPVVSTVHDAGPLLRPELQGPLHRLHARWVLRPALRRAQALIAVSESTRVELAECLGIERERIHVVHEAPAAHFQPPTPEAVAELRKRLDLHGPWLFAPGMLAPRKSLRRLLAAFRALRLRHPALTLVLCGNPASAERDLLRLLESGEPGVRWLGYVDDALLPALYGGAEATLLISSHEGFGLPAVEAMACGSALVLSDLPVLREVAGNAAEFVPHDDPGALAARLDELLRNPARREALRAAGAIRRRAFDWQRTVAATREVHETVLGRRREAVPLRGRPEQASALAWAVVRTLAYVDLFDSGLTLAELHRGLHGHACTEHALAEALRSDPWLQQRVACHEGVHHLQGRERVVATRRAREAAADRYFARQAPALRLVSLLPFVRMVALSGGAAHRTSLHREDLDLFIVAEEGRAWSAMAACILTTKLLGMREDVCANYLVDEAHLAIDLQRDAYTAHQFVHLWPVLGEEAHRKLWAANPWVAEHFPNAAPRGLAPEGQSLRRGLFASALERLLSPLEPHLEWSARMALSTWLRMRHPGADPGLLRLLPGSLKLHVKDHRRTTLTRFAAALEREASSWPSTVPGPASSPSAPEPRP